MPQDIVSQFDRKFALPIETYRQVLNPTLRDSIPDSIRWEGMLVYVVSEGKSYELKGGLDNTFWTDIGSLVNVTVVDNLLSSSTTDALSANQGRILSNNFSSYQQLSQKGVANGYAPLNSSAKIDSSFLPSYVDDILEYPDLASFPATGETGKLYAALDTNFIYRWSGSSYIQVGGVGAVESVFGRIGPVVAESGDYSAFYLGIGATAANSFSLNGKPMSSIGNRFDVIPFVESDGVIEIGKYIDFHQTNNSSVDFSLRLEANSGNLLLDGSKVWTQGNDGSGSDLDADTLDGQHGSYYDQRVYSSQTNYLGGGFVSGGLEKPDWFNKGKLKLQMLRGSSGVNLGAPADWNDVLWMSSYIEENVKGSNLLIFGKDVESVGFCRQDFDSTSWGTYRAIWHSGNSFIMSGSNAIFSGTVTATNFILSSDARLKEKITPLNNVDNSLLYSYYRKDEPNKQRFGTIAQEVEKVYPDLVVENEEGEKSVLTTDLLFKIISKQEEKIELLEQKLNLLINKYL